MGKRTTRKQKGGYYYSVYEGIRNAGLLLPLVVRQGYRLLNRKTKRARRRGQSLKAIKTPDLRRP
jgi:hypothetical protein